MIHEIVLNDCLHPQMPPETVLVLTVVEDTAFVSIGKYDEDNKTRTVTTLHEIAVSLPALREALQLLRNDEERESVRPEDPGSSCGEKGARLAGVRHSVVPL